MNPKVKYNRNLKLAAVGPSVWAKLGPERWFSDYVIVCANSRDFTEDWIYDLGFGVRRFEKMTTQGIVDTPEFQAVANGPLADYRFIAYRPVDVPVSLAPQRFIANAMPESQFENKRIFRERFDQLLPLPKYKVVTFEELFAQTPAEAYKRFCEKLGSKLVLQDEVGGGGRGTFFADSAHTMGAATQVLKTERKGDACVISRFIPGKERSVQVFVSAGQIISGPLQQQLVRNSELLDPEGRGGMYFCGGKFVHDEAESVKTQIDHLIQITAQKLKTAGYRGVFGLDFLVGNDKKVQVLEINARTTGVLPLLNELPSAHPLYLLHILELAGEPYEILPKSSAAATPGPGSFVTLFNQTGKDAWFDDQVTTGNYRFTDGRLEQIDDQPRWHPRADLMLQLFCSRDFPAKPNLKLCNVFLRDEGFNDEGHLHNATSQKIALLKQHVVR